MQKVASGGEPLEQSGAVALVERLGSCCGRVPLASGPSREMAEGCGYRASQELYCVLWSRPVGPKALDASDDREA